MPVLKMNHYGTKRALRHEALRDLPILGRGMFCTVFDKGDTVLKLTADHIQYHFYTDYCAPQGPYYPTMIRDYGIVGEQGEYVLYLVEMEKLTPFGRRDEVADLAWLQRRELMRAYQRHRVRVISKFWHIINPVMFSSSLDAAVLNELALDESIDKDMREVVGELSMFVCNYQCTTDLHRANFMLRGDQLVLNDVVADVESLCALKSRRRC